MRGTHLPSGLTEVGSGIIPAHAGNTKTTKTIVSNGKDHPRACGEHFQIADQQDYVAGSSPRMRGTQFGRDAVLEAGGIIPAHAGNTTCLGGVHRHRWDHPRACGEHCRILSHKKGVVGSSPRMRGTHTVMRTRLRIDGIIPAHAGNTCVAP